MSYIYFVQIADTGPIKIGFTSRPPRIRITKMQTDVSLADKSLSA